MPGNVGWPGLIVILLVLLLIFGPKRLPEMGRSLGRGMREFKDSITGDKDDEPRREELPPPVVHTTAPSPPPAQTTRPTPSEPESERVP